MELRQLSHFLAVSETLNFHAAADQLNLTTQAVSKSIRQLETTLGVKLFDRDTRTVALTSFGALLLPHATAIQSESKQFQRSLETTLGAHTGLVRLGATPTALTQLVPQALEKLLEDRPTLRVEIERSDFEHLTPSLLMGDLDLIVSTAPTAPVDSLIAIEPLVDDANVIVCSAQHDLATRTPTVSDLATQKWITLNFARGDEDLANLFSASGLKPPQANLETTAVDFAIDWVARSDYLSILPAQVAAVAVADGRLSTLDMLEPGNSWPIILAYRRNATRSPAALALIAMLKIVALGQADLR